MFIKPKIIMLVLIAFCSCLSLNNHSKIEKITASEVVWEEAITIESGDAYLITAEKEGVTYYLPTGIKTTGTKQAVEFDSTKENTNLWTFNLSDDKYQIVDNNENILYAEGNIVNQHVLASKTGGNDVDSKYWKLENGKLKTGPDLKWTLSYEPLNNIWTPKPHEDRISNIKFYSFIGNESLIEATSFSDWIMGQPDGDIVTSQCSTKYQTAKEKWNELPSSEQELFKNSESFNDARLRLTNWATANGETIADFYNNNVSEVKNERANNNDFIFIQFALVLLVGGLIISKRIKAKE